MKKMLVLSSTVLLATSCSSIGSFFRDECHEINWDQKGREAFLSNKIPQDHFAGIASSCEGGTTENHKAIFFNAFKDAKMSQCVGIENITKLNMSDYGQRLATKGESFDSHLGILQKCDYGPKTKEEMNDYKTGYQSALSAMCTRLGGVEFARKNHIYKNTCPANLEKDFNLGRSVGSKMKEVDDLTKTLDQITKNISEEEAKNIKYKSIISECNEKLQLVREKKDPGSSFMAECNGSTERDFLAKINSSKKDLFEVENKINELKRKLESTNRTIELKYKEIEVLNNALK